MIKCFFDIIMYYFYEKIIIIKITLKYYIKVWKNKYKFYMLSIIGEKIKLWNLCYM